MSAQLIIDKSGIALTVPEIIDALLERVIAQVERRVPWRPGARELLLELGALGVPVAARDDVVASLADTVVRQPARRAPSTALVTGDEVSHGKPHPEPYLAAARLVGADPADCVALEDSPAGVRSATAAGVPTIAIPHVVPVPQVDGAVHIDTLAGVARGRPHDDRRPRSGRPPRCR